jgi:hypothetical protein
MEALKRKAPTSMIDSITLSDGTRVDYMDISIAKETELQKTVESNSKRWSEFEKNLYLLVPHLLVEGKEITVDDLKEGFSVSELEQIGEMLMNNKKKSPQSQEGT